MDKWIKVQDRLPDEIEPILVYSKNKYGGYTKKIGVLDDERWFNWETYKLLFNQPTHWQPLPESPK